MSATVAAAASGATLADDGAGQGFAVAVPVERTAPGIVGTVRDAAGRALCGWAVLLNAQGKPALPAVVSLGRAALDAERSSPPRIGKRAVTAADGTFTFEDLAPGECEVTLEKDQRVVERFVLAPGERRAVSLRLLADRVAVTVTLTKGGDPDQGHGIEVVLANGNRVSADPDQHGLIRCVLPAGLHRLRVHRSAPGLMGGGLPFTSEHSLDVPRGVPTADRQFEVGGTTLEVAVDDGAAGPIDALMFTVEGRTTIGVNEHTFTFGGRDGRCGVLEELPPGRWTVRAGSPWLTAVPPQEVVCGSWDQRARIAFTAQRATIVRLSVLSTTGPLALPVAALPPFRSGGEERPCVNLAAILPAGSSRAGATKTAVAGYTSVPLGRGDLMLEDRDLDGAVQFLPFDPVASTCIDVVDGDHNEVTLHVEPRALVDLRGCERGGREDLTARIQVFAGDRRVRAFDQQQSHRWQSFLPPGDYRIVVDRQGRIREEFLRVDRTNLQRRLRP